MIDDAEIRGVLLKHFHKLRDANGGWCPTDENILSPHPVSRAAIANAGQHLAEAGYIRWEPFNPPMEHHAIGRAKITGPGIDVVTGARAPIIDIRFPDSGAAPGCFAPASPGSPPATVRPISDFLAGVEAPRSTAPLSEIAISAVQPPETKKDDVLILRPAFMGMGINLNEAWRRLSTWRKKYK